MSVLVEGVRIGATVSALPFYQLCRGAELRNIYLGDSRVTDDADVAVSSL